MKKTLIDTAMYLGLVLVMVGIILPLFMGPQTMLYKYLFAAGAVLILIARVLTTYRGPHLRVKRLSRILVWSALFYCTGAFFMFYSPKPQDWLAFVLAGAVIQCYVSIAMPRVMRKSLEEDRAKADTKKKKK